MADFETNVIKHPEYISKECIYLPEHFKGRIEVNLCPWYWNGSMHIGSLDEAALRLTLVVLCNQRINQFKRQSQTCKKQSI